MSDSLKFFDWKFYVSYYDDLHHINNYEKAYQHWQHSGSSQDRICNKKMMIKQLPDGFQWENYIALHSDLKDQNKYEAINHWHQYGKNEKRVYNDTPQTLDSIKVSIVMAYHNRKSQLIATLNSIKNSQYKNIEVIIVDDASDDSQKINEIPSLYNFDIKLYVIDNQHKIWKNPCIAYNFGFKKATGDIIIIQNAEILHVGDVINYVATHLGDTDYFAFSCYASPSPSINQKFIGQKKISHIKSLIEQIDYKNYDFDWKYYVTKYNDLSNLKTFEQAFSHWTQHGQQEGRFGNKHGIYYNQQYIKWNGWYNHPIFNPRPLHFLTATLKTNIEKVGGFNEIFADGLWYDDDEFLSRIKLICNVTNFDDNDFFGIHQYHLSGSSQHIKNRNQVKDLVEINRLHYDQSLELIKKNPSAYNWTTLSSSISQSCPIPQYTEITNLIKVSTVIAYYNRLDLLHWTLNSILKTQHPNFEIIIVNDCSPDFESLSQMVLSLQSKTIKLINMDPLEKKDRTNPSVVFNLGFLNCSGDIIIIQNPECYHYGDIISHVVKNMTPHNYLVYPVYTLFNDDENHTFDVSIPRLVNKNYDNITKVFEGLPSQRWLQHSIYKPSKYHFCTAIHKHSLKIIKGFDPQYAKGYCFDDDDFVLKIEKIMKLQVIQIDPCSETFIVNLWHPPSLSTDCVSKNDHHPIKSKWLLNKNYFDSKVCSLVEDFKYPRILHTYWDGSKMSFLNYLTYVSFKKYHPAWILVCHMPKKRTLNKTWTTDENKTEYIGNDYLEKLKQLEYVTINYIDESQYQIDPDLPEVIKSDIFRYNILYDYGGLWSDTDIIYIKNLERDFIDKGDSILFKMEYPSNGRICHYYPIGLLISKPRQKIFKEIINLIQESLNVSQYQSVGSQLIDQYLISQNQIANYDHLELSIIDGSCYLPFDWRSIDNIFGKNSHQKLVDKTIGIHWFNGSDISKFYNNNFNQELENNSLMSKLIKDYKFIEYL